MITLPEEPAVDLDPHVFGDQSPCFGCAPHHPIGFQLRFQRVGDVVATRWTPADRYQGPPGILHGGLVTTLADELAAWTVVGLKERMGFTASLEGRLKRPVRVGQEVLGVGRIVADKRRLVDVAIELQQDGEVAFAGSFVFVILDRKGAERLIGAMPDAWERFCR